VLARAEADAGEVVGSARQEADAEETEARRRAAEAGRARLEWDLARARADANHEILAVRAELRGRLIAEARRAAVELRRHPRYPELLDRLEALARSQLGPAAAIDRAPGPAGGLVATAGHRRVDYSLPSLAERALADLEDEVTASWN